MKILILVVLFGSQVYAANTFKNYNIRAKEKDLKKLAKAEVVKVNNAKKRAEKAYKSAEKKRKASKK